MSYKCPFCGELEPSINWLRIHIRKCHYNEPLTCPVCGYRARSLRGIINHSCGRYDEKHKALYYLLHRNTRNTTGAKVEKQMTYLKQLKEVFKV
ncbi:hypothetical protein [Acidianus ambivalens]|uniref:Di19 zinc-binding domain-containing protein n=1 Tax=Acidianus ambivalens TaxID=2283 RepID=A0A650CT94_ACIAM|nr:hypothetical protein [Acidianus ambivalens]MQL56437.1 hypothetical protein [Acidianus ambivalens]QGR21074.1 hypothetical protein D1866_02835 [Acidianus ambivalens]